jgi:hypothetical protein
MTTVGHDPDTQSRKATIRDEILKKIHRQHLKGTVARDFWPLVFFMDRPQMGP